MSSTMQTEQAAAASSIDAHDGSDHGHGGRGHGGAGHAAGPKMDDGHQQHPLGVYFTVWILLFVLSAGSYAVDYFDFHGFLRSSLIITFMLLKAGFIVAIFMHMRWERLALVVAILLPPLAVLVFMATMAFEGNYTNDSRATHFDSINKVENPHARVEGAPAHTESAPTAKVETPAPAESSPTKVETPAQAEAPAKVEAPAQAENAPAKAEAPAQVESAPPQAPTPPAQAEAPAHE